MDADTRGHPVISLIAAVAANGVIGRSGTMPWRIPDDMARFRRLTMGHALIMGRATCESMGRPLAGRTNIVLTRNPAWTMTGCKVANDPEAALAAAGGDAEVFVIGGAAVYAVFLPLAQRLYLTWVDAEVDGDTSFPEVRWDQWEVTAEVQPPHAAGVLPHRFVDYVRKAR